MTTALRPHWPSAADRALDLAERLREEALAQGQPPAIQGFPRGPAPPTTGSSTPSTACRGP